MNTKWSFQKKSKKSFLNGRKLASRIACSLEWMLMRWWWYPPAPPVLHLALQRGLLIGGGWRSAEGRGRVLFSALRLPCRVTLAPSLFSPKTPKTFCLEISTRSSQLRPLRFRQFPKRFASFSLFVNNIEIPGCLGYSSYELECLHIANYQTKQLFLLISILFRNKVLYDFNRSNKFEPKYIRKVWHIYSTSHVKKKP